MQPSTIKSEEEAILKTPKSDEEIMLDLLLVTIMGFPPNSDVKQALNDAGVRSIVDIFTLEDNLISHLAYHDGAERVSLKLLDISKLRKIGPFHEALCDRKNVYALTDYQWATNVESQDWREYCVDPKSLEEALNRQQLRERQLPHYAIPSPSRSRKTQRLIHHSRKPSGSFTARRICTI